MVKKKLKILLKTKKGNIVSFVRINKKTAKLNNVKPGYAFVFKKNNKLITGKKRFKNKIMIMKNFNKMLNNKLKK